MIMFVKGRAGQWNAWLGVLLLAALLLQGCGGAKAVRYGEHPRQVADLYLPKGILAPVPAVVYFHGGGFRAGDKALDDLTRQLKTDFTSRGIAFVSANYRYATDGLTLRDSMQDGLALVTYLQQHADSLTLDAQRIALMGGSAGGGIAQFVALQANGLDESLPGVRSVALLNAQSSYNPQHWNLIGGQLCSDPDFDAFTGPLGDTLNDLSAGLLHRDAEAGVALLDAVSGVTLIDAQDPPVAFFYWTTELRPYSLTEISNGLPGYDHVIHHPMLGEAFQLIAQDRGHVTEVHLVNDYAGLPRTAPLTATPEAFGLMYQDLLRFTLESLLN